MKKIWVTAILLLIPRGYENAIAAEYHVQANSQITIIKEESPALTSKYEHSLPTTAFKQHMRPAAITYSGGTFDFISKWVDRSSGLRMIEGKPSIEETSAYPWQGVGLIAETTLLADLNDEASYYLSVFGNAKVMPAYGDSRALPGLAYINVAASCAGHLGNTNRVNGTPYTGRTADGGWLAKEQAPFEMLSAGFPGFTFSFKKSQCPDGRIKVQVTMEGKKIEFHGIEATLSELF